MRNLLWIVFLALGACNSEYSVKPRAYYTINFPQRNYQLFDQAGYPYTFEYPHYAVVVKDSTYFDQEPENPFWINIDFPEFDGRIYLSYKSLKVNDYEKLVDDAFKLTYKHTAKASQIVDSLMITPEGITGVFFKVGGNAATAKQFFLTDSTEHFIRGALYFDATPNADSLKLVNDFLEADMRHMINSFRWR